MANQFFIWYPVLVSFFLGIYAFLLKKYIRFFMDWGMYIPILLLARILLLEYAGHLSGAVVLSDLVLILLILTVLFSSAKGKIPGRVRTFYLVLISIQVLAVIFVSFVLEGQTGTGTGFGREAIIDTLGITGFIAFGIYIYTRKNITASIKFVIGFLLLVKVVLSFHQYIPGFKNIPLQVSPELAWNVVLTSAVALIYVFLTLDFIEHRVKAENKIESSLGLFGNFSRANPAALDDTTGKTAEHLVPAKSGRHKEEFIYDEIAAIVRIFASQVKSESEMLFLKNEMDDNFFRWDRDKGFALPGFDSDTNILLSANSEYENIFSLSGPVSLESENINIESGTGVDSRAPLLKFMILIPLLKGRRVVALMAAARNSISFSNDEIEMLRKMIPLYSFLIYDRISLIAQFDSLYLRTRFLLASEIQGRLLMNKSADFDHISCSVSTKPAMNVHSDFHGYLHDPKNRSLTVYVGDVTGKDINHGTQAIILIRSVLDLLIRGRNDPAKILKIVNNMFIRDEKIECFAQISIMQFDVDTSTIVMSSAGNTGFYIFRLTTGDVEVVPASDIVVGIDDAAGFSCIRKNTGSGDIFLCCTDGVADTMDELGNQFGQDRVSAILRENYFLPAEDLRDKIYQEISLFRGKIPVHDDRTIGIIKIL